MGGGRGKIGGPQYKNLDKKTTGKIIKMLGGYILKSWPLFLIAIALTLISNQLALMGPMYSGDAIDAITGENGVDFAAVGKNIVNMLVCYLLSAIMTYFLSILMIRISQRIIYTMRRQVFEKLTSLPIN